METINATAFATVEVNNSFVAIFAENQDNTGATLELQCSLEEDDKDGMCLVLDGCAFYQAIEKYNLESGRLHLELTPDAAQALRTDQDIEVLFDSEDTEKVRQSLDNIFK